MTNEVFISVDVETSGPIPGEYSLLQIGACTIHKAGPSFECYVKPVNGNAVPEALAVTGLRLEEMNEIGLSPTEAMRSFASWISKAAGGNCLPIFVGFNAPFDWSFVNYYFNKYIGYNPFGISGVDIKSLYMGAEKSSWAATSSEEMAKALGVVARGNHTALKDAQFQAELFSRIMRLS